MPPLDDATRIQRQLPPRAARTETDPVREILTETGPIRESAPAAPPPAPPLPPAPPVPAVSPTPAWLNRMSGRLIAALSIGWVGLLIAATVQPLPDNPHASLPAWAIAVNMVADIALLATLVGFAVRQRWALLTSALAAFGWVVAVAACPLVDHHETVGALWATLLAISAGLVAASATALARTRRS
jgi:hypothetical protein